MEVSGLKELMLGFSEQVDKNQKALEAFMAEQKAMGQVMMDIIEGKIGPHTMTIGEASTRRQKGLTGETKIVEVPDFDGD